MSPLLTEAIRQALRVECPVCGVAQFNVCRSPTSYPHAAHLARWDEALAEEIEQALATPNPMNHTRTGATS